jgi:hypothetical protein
MCNLWTQDSTISTATRPQTGRRVNQHRFLVGQRYFDSPQHKSSGAIFVKLKQSEHLHLFLRLRMRGATYPPPLPCRSSRPGTI